jgi:hypothetical protein
VQLDATDARVMIIVARSVANVGKAQVGIGRVEDGLKTLTTARSMAESHSVNVFALLTVVDNEPFEKLKAWMRRAKHLLKKWSYAAAQLTLGSHCFDNRPPTPYGGLLALARCRSQMPLPMRGAREFPDDAGAPK